MPRFRPDRFEAWIGLETSRAGKRLRAQIRQCCGRALADFLNAAVVWPWPGAPVYNET